MLAIAKKEKNMKKMIMFGVFFFCLTLNCYAENLNFRTNMLMDYEYQVDQYSYIFQIYENNENDRLIFTTNPEQMPSYERIYRKLKLDETNLNSNELDKLKKYMWITQKEDDFPTQMNYYIGTQLLLWQYFHPEVDVVLDGKEEKIKAVEELNITPSWIHDYEIEEELRIEKSAEFALSSTSCEIKEEENDWVISNCSENAMVKVNETMEDELTIYHNYEQYELFEVGASPISWIMNITVKEKIEEEPKEPEEVIEEEKTPEEEPEKEPEEEPEEPQKPEEPEIENPSEIEKEEEEPSKIPEEEKPEVIESVDSFEKKEEPSLENGASDKIRVENVPNTEENRSVMPFLLPFIMLLYTLKWKKSKLA